MKEFTQTEFGDELIVALQSMDAFCDVYTGKQGLRQLSRSFLPSTRPTSDEGWLNYATGIVQHSKEQKLEQHEALQPLFAALTWRLYLTHDAVPPELLSAVKEEWRPTSAPFADNLARLPNLFKTWQDVAQEHIRTFWVPPYLSREERDKMVEQLREDPFASALEAAWNHLSKAEQEKLSGPELKTLRDGHELRRLERERRGFFKKIIRSTEYLGNREALELFVSNCGNALSRRKIVEVSRLERVFGKRVPKPVIEAYFLYLEDLKSPARHAKLINEKERSVGEDKGKAKEPEWLQKRLEQRQTSETRQAAVSQSESPEIDDPGSDGDYGTTQLNDTRQTSETARRSEFPTELVEYSPPSPRWKKRLFPSDNSRQVAAEPPASEIQITSTPKPSLSKHVTFSDLRADAQLPQAQPPVAKSALRWIRFNDDRSEPTSSASQRRAAQRAFRRINDERACPQVDPERINAGFSDFCELPAHGKESLKIIGWTAKPVAELGRKQQCYFVVGSNKQPPELAAYREVLLGGKLYSLRGFDLVEDRGALAVRPNRSPGKSPLIGARRTSPQRETARLLIQHLPTPQPPASLGKWPEPRPLTFLPDVPQGEICGRYGEGIILKFPTTNRPEAVEYRVIPATFLAHDRFQSPERSFRTGTKVSFAEKSRGASRPPEIVVSGWQRAERAPRHARGRERASSSLGL